MGEELYFNDELRKCLDAAGLSDCGENDAWNYWYQRVHKAHDQAMSEARLARAEDNMAESMTPTEWLSDQLREVHGLRAFAELFGFSWEDDSDWTWHDVACAMADAVDAATVGAGTCRMVPGRVFPKCSACGATMGRVDKYCSQCGMRVEVDA